MQTHTSPEAGTLPPEPLVEQLSLANRLLNSEEAIQRRDATLLALAAQIAVYDLGPASAFRPSYDSPKGPTISAEDRVIGTDLYAAVLAASFGRSRIPKHRVVGYSRHHVQVSTGYREAGRKWNPDWLTSRRWRSVHSAAYEEAVTKRSLDVPATAKEAARFLRHAPKRVAALAFEGCEFSGDALQWVKPEPQDPQLKKAHTRPKVVLTESGLIAVIVGAPNRETHHDLSLVPMVPAKGKSSTPAQESEPWYDVRLRNRPPRPEERAAIEDHVVEAVEQERSEGASMSVPWWEARGYAL